MENVNEYIIKNGTIVEATKLPVITIGIGAVKNLKDLKGTIWHENGKVVIATKEAPKGCTYDQDRIAVVRIISGKVKMHGLYDIYALERIKAEKLLSKPFELNSLPIDQLKELQPILNASSEVRPSITPAEHGRKVIIITDEMIGERGYIYCHCPWDPDDVMTKMFKGDVFVIKDEATCKGYRIGKEEFDGTHMLVNSKQVETDINKLDNNDKNCCGQCKQQQIQEQKITDDKDLEM